MRYKETLGQQYPYSIPQEGKIEWIGIRPKRMAKVYYVSEVLANPDTGLEGDHFRKSSTGKRQVTLIQQEHLEVVTRILSKSKIPPEWLRRNIVVSGINLLVLKKTAILGGRSTTRNDRNLRSLQPNGRKPRSWRLQQHAWAWRYYC